MGISTLPIISSLDGFEAVPGAEPPLVHLRYRDPSGATYSLPVRRDQLVRLQSQIRAVLDPLAHTAIPAGDDPALRKI